MTAVETTAPALNSQQLNLLMQYTVEAYKMFEKFAENLPNPMTAAMFKEFAAEERLNRDLLEEKIDSAGTRVKTTLGADLSFQQALEGDLSFRESVEFLIAREKTMQKRLDDLARNAADVDRNLLIYLVAVKRSHLVELERELTLIRFDADWWKREDAETRIVHGTRSA
jgi:rubrerythrin